MALLVVAGIFLAGCGAKADAKVSADADGPSNTPTPASAPTPTRGGSDSPQPARGGELLPVVQAYSDAFLTGNARASRALLSERCRDRVSATEWQALVAQAARQYGTALKIKTYHAEVSGNLARISYTYDVAGINQDKEPWVREGGRWHEDDC